MRYILNIEQNFPKWLEEQNEEHDTALYLLLTYYYFLNYLADSEVLSHADQGSFLLASKTSTDVYAIYSCLKSGCVHQASIILRSLFETAVTTKFIYGDLKYRMKLFLNYKYIEKHLAIKKDKRIIPANEHAEIGRMFEQIKHQYNLKSSWYSKHLWGIMEQDSKLKHKYRKANFKALCEVVQMNGDYDKLYGALSMTVHGSPVVDHLFVSKGSFTAAPVFNSMQIITTSSLAIHYAHTVFRYIVGNSENQSAKKMIDYSTWLSYASAKVAKEANSLG